MAGARISSNAGSIVALGFDVDDTGRHANLSEGAPNRSQVLAHPDKCPWVSDDPQSRVTREGGVCV